MNNLSKVAIIGLGSMGQRRIRLLKENFSYELVGFDYSEKRRKETYERFQINLVDNIEDLLKIKELKCVFSCVSPTSHIEIIKLVTKFSVPVFSELNLILDDFESVLNIEHSGKNKIFLSSTMLYRNELKRVTNNYDQKSVNYSYIVGQYLPDWHPWESYKDFFVSNINTNAIREILAIELPWMINAFGDIVEFKVMLNKISKLEINYPDIIHVLFKHNNGSTGYLGIDLVSRKPIRNLRISNEDSLTIWGGTPESYAEYDLNLRSFSYFFQKSSSIKDNNYADFIVEDAYLDEIKAFFEYIDNDIKPIYSFKKHEVILSLVDAIEKA